MGGIETWTVQMLQRLNRESFQVDILVHTLAVGFYDREVRALGGRLIPCLHPSRPWAYARNFFRVLRQYGPYDVVHSHVFRFSGFVLRLAAAAKIPLRLAHSRNTAERRQASLPRLGYNQLMRYWLNKYATHLLAVSREAAIALFGAQSLHDPRLQILPSGIDLTPFRDPSPLLEKRSLGLPASCKVVGHIGRFTEAKNHSFLLQIARQLVQRDRHVCFLFVGDGPLQPEIYRQTKDLELTEKVFFAGTRHDVPAILKGAVDLILFPSKWEGSPRVVIEAQAAGVPCLISTAIPSGIEVVKPLVRRLSLQAAPAIWAELALTMLQQPRPVTAAEALQQVAESPFNIENNVKLLENIYFTALHPFAEA